MKSKFIALLLLLIASISKGDSSNECISAYLEYDWKRAFELCSGETSDASVLYAKYLLNSNIYKKTELDSRKDVDVALDALEALMKMGSIKALLILQNISWKGAVEDNDKEKQSMMLRRMREYSGLDTDNPNPTYLLEYSSMLTEFYGDNNFETVSLKDKAINLLIASPEYYLLYEIAMGLELDIETVGTAHAYGLYGYPVNDQYGYALLSSIGKLDALSYFPHLRKNNPAFPNSISGEMLMKTKEAGQIIHRRIVAPLRLQNDPFEVIRFELKFGLMRLFKILCQLNFNFIGRSGHPVDLQNESLAAIASNSSSEQGASNVLTRSKYRRIAA